MSQNCSFLTKAYVAQMLIIFAKEVKDSNDIAELSKFFNLCKTCIISGAVFEMVTAHYELCCMIAKNKHLTMNQTCALFECEAVKQNKTGHHDMFIALFKNNNNVEANIVWLQNKQKEILAEIVQK